LVLPVSDGSFRFARVRGQLIWVPAGASRQEIEAALEEREARASATADVAAALPTSFVHDDPRPLLLADVDGVVCPYGDELADPAAAGLELATVGYMRVWLSRDIRQHLKRLTAPFQLVWCTAWEDRAAEFLAPFLGLPPLPVIHFDEPAEEDGHWKWPGIEEFVGDRPFAWIDDELGRADLARAGRRSSPSMLVRIEGSHGLNERHVEQLEGFAETLRVWPDPAK
jgi:HAD domain in Swiss Army Knife RNA repair proteins